MRLDADRFFNVIDSLFVEDAIKDAKLEGAFRKTRRLFDVAYNRKVYMYGGSNDEAAELADGEELSPYGTRSGTLLPDESGYPGLDPPVG